MNDVVMFPNRITLRIDSATEAAINRVAAKRRKKASEIGREAIVAYLNRAGELRDPETDTNPCGVDFPDYTEAPLSCSEHEQAEKQGNHPR